MAKFSVIYVALCELVFGLMVGCLGFSVMGGSGSRDYIFGAAMISLAALNLGTSIGLAGSRQWAWYGSWVIGLIVVAMSWWLIRVAMQPDPYGDSGEAGIFGLAFLVFALPAFVLLSLRSTRIHLHVSKV